jgi:hypothetical protein
MVGDSDGAVADECKKATTTMATNTSLNHLPPRKRLAAQLKLDVAAAAHAGRIDITGARRPRDENSSGEREFPAAGSKKAGPDRQCLPCHPPHCLPSFL